MAAQKKTSAGSKWSAEVTEKSDALDLEENIFEAKDPKKTESIWPGTATCVVTPPKPEQNHYSGNITCLNSPLIKLISLPWAVFLRVPK
ncbi:DUF3175 domain-containing protein [Parapedobacter koreensis]|uniref:Uncharacterized protein n=1 Tax=Parapedobacter koreensis TaxID=332977 RepID=A0A1H7LUV6_9SPHI|nr:DUF3175 domain-containing protein [Parapedobacter koreensis]SEL02692.1 Protein of unknown function [Parapedobacter koreensis]